MGKVFVQDAPPEDDYTVDLLLLLAFIFVLGMVVRSKFKRE